MKDITPAARAAMDAGHTSAWTTGHSSHPPPRSPRRWWRQRPSPPTSFRWTPVLSSPALTGVVEIARGGDPDNPSPDSILAVAELLDKAVTNAPVGWADRAAGSYRAMWDDLLDGPT